MRNSVWCLAFDYVFSWAICKNYSSNWDLESETSVIWANDSNYVAPPDCSSTSWHAASARKKHSANLTCVICHTKKENIQTHLWTYICISTCRKYTTHLWTYICISTCRKYTNTLVDLYMHINMQVDQPLFAPVTNAFQIPFKQLQVDHHSTLPLPTRTSIATSRAP